MKKVAILTLVFSIMVATPIATHSVNILEPTEYFYVNDFANVFSEKEKILLAERANEFASTHGIQIVIVTVEGVSEQQSDEEEYVDKIYSQYRIGESSDIGILILALKEGPCLQFMIKKNMKAEYCIIADYLKCILDIAYKYAVPNLNKGKVKEALISLQKKLIDRAIIEPEKLLGLIPMTGYDVIFGLPALSISPIDTLNTITSFIFYLLVFVSIIMIIGGFLLGIPSLIVLGVVVLILSVFLANIILAVVLTSSLIAGIVALAQGAVIYAFYKTIRG